MGYKILMLNQSWLAPELGALGHQVVTAGQSAPHLDINFEPAETSWNELLGRLPEGFIPDRIVYHDNSGTPWITGLVDAEPRKLFYSIDTHHHAQWHVLFAAIFDRVLVAQSSYIAQFVNNSGQVFWFPPWAPITLEPIKEKRFDVCFRGTFDQKLNPHRIEFFERVKALLPGDYGPGDYTQAYPSARIVLNQAVKNDLNFRVFEALMCGALLVTPADTTGLTDLFVPGEDLVVYQPGSAEHAAELAKEYLADEDARARIAAHGRATVLRAHTKEVRARELCAHLDQLNGILPNPLRYHCAAQSYLFAVFVAHHYQVRPGPLLLLAAVSNLERSIAHGEAVDPDSRIGFALMLGSKIRAAGLGKDEVRLFTALRREYPQPLLVALGLIDALLADGSREEARRIASELSSDPDQLLGQVPAIMAETRGDFWK